ncbi:WhiB family transcriptional regulator [Streptomyces cavernae]|uniref:WhiB family transcriptional regulator n=1 Tax=Streptomyces cavernae TaxID=2259034 RepID=UPI000FEC1916|nr:WhiB family transcriptional regulator [Streptomyces cavernae]
MEWLDRAACVDADPDLFFPVSRNGPAVRDALAAKRICCRCPVVEDCLDWALSTRQTTGVWGGTSEEERADLIRASRLAS